jgi:hypothetical protein
VKRIRGKKNPVSAAGLKSLRDEYTRTIEPARAQASEALLLKHRLSDLVNAAYGVTPDEVTLHCTDPISHRLAFSFGVEYDPLFTAISDRSEVDNCISSTITHPVENLRDCS